MYYICLYEPEIAQNVGAIFRTCSCKNLKVIIIEPTGFLWINVKFRRAQLDYSCDVDRVNSFHDFIKKYHNYRKILLTAHCDLSITAIKLQPEDILVFGRESNGIEAEYIKYFNLLTYLPMNNKSRSFNLAASVNLSIGYLNMY